VRYWTIRDCRHECRVKLPHKAIVPLPPDRRQRRYLCLYPIPYAERTRMGEGARLRHDNELAGRTRRHRRRTQYRMGTLRRRTPYSIAYIGISYERRDRRRRLGEARLKNRDGKFVLPKTHGERRGAADGATSAPRAIQPDFRARRAILSDRQFRIRIVTAISGPRRSPRRCAISSPGPSIRSAAMPAAHAGRQLRCRCRRDRDSEPEADRNDRDRPLRRRAAGRYGLRSPAKVSTGDIRPRIDRSAPILSG